MNVHTVKFRSSGFEGTSSCYPLLPKSVLANILSCLGSKDQIHWSEISVTLGIVGRKFYCMDGRKIFYATGLDRTGGSNFVLGVHFQAIVILRLISMLTISYIYKYSNYQENYPVGFHFEFDIKLRQYVQRNTRTLCFISNILFAQTSRNYHCLSGVGKMTLMSLMSLRLISIIQ